MTRVTNGMGASEDISYGTIAEPDREMPLGMLPHIVKSVGSKAVVDPAATYDAQTNYSYSGATYSRRQRRLLGFKHVENADSKRILAANVEMTDECGARRTTEELFDNSRQLITRTKFVFAPTGYKDVTSTSGGPHAYSLCRTDTIQREEWERSTQPRLSEDQLTYDDYGNVVGLIQTGDSVDSWDDRKIERGFNVNSTDFIVDRAAYQAVYGVNTVGAWQRLAWTQYDYDHSQDYTYPPPSLGELTRVRRWNDQTDGFSTTVYEYDKQGNVRVVTGPPIPSNPSGISTTIDYDCEFNRFPEKVCDPLLCTSISWDKRLGV